MKMHRYKAGAEAPKEVTMGAAVSDSGRSLELDEKAFDDGTSVLVVLKNGRRLKGVCREQPSRQSDMQEPKQFVDLEEVLSFADGTEVRITIFVDPDALEESEQRAKSRSSLNQAMGFRSGKSPIRNEGCRLVLGVMTPSEARAYAAQKGVER